jgi:hypothetical protein
MKFGTALLGRLASPAGLVLAGLCFLLPFVSVSCSSGPSEEHVEMTLSYSGKDLVAGGWPDLHYVDSQQTVDQADLRRSPLSGTPLAPFPVEPFAVAVVTLLAVGIVAALIRRAAPRQLAVGTVALVSAVLLVGAELRARNEAARQLEPYTGQTIEQLRDRIDLARGFWLALAVLLAVGCGSIVRYVWHSRSTDANRPTQADAA